MTGMSPTELEALVRRLAPDLAQFPEPWAVIGSGALIISGAPLADCPDLDIVTTGAGAALLEEAWRDWRHGDDLPDPAAAFRSRFSRYSAPEGAVEVMGDLQLRTGAGWRPVVVGATERRRFGGLEVSLPTAGEQLRMLREFGRPKDLARAKQLEAWLAAG